MAEDERGKRTVRMLFEAAWSDPNTKMTNEAQEVAYALFKSMVEEAVLRSEKAAREMGDEEVDAKHLERVLVQYLLDF